MTIRIITKSQYRIIVIRIRYSKNKFNLLVLQKQRTQVKISNCALQR